MRFTRLGRGWADVRRAGPPAQRAAALLVPIGYPAPDAAVPDLERRRLDEMLVRI